MTTWSDRITGHAALQELDTLSRALSDIEEFAHEDREAAQSFARLAAIVRYMERLLSAIDPELIAPNPLNTIAPYLQQMTAEVRAYSSNRGRQHLANANAHADAVLLQAPYFAIPRSPEDVEGIRENMTAFRRSAGQHWRHLEDSATAIRTKASELDSKLQELTTEIAQQRTRLDSAIATVQQQAVQAEASRNEMVQQQLLRLQQEQDQLRTQLQQNADARAEQFQQLVATFQQTSAKLETDFIAAQAERKDKFGIATMEWRDEVAAFIKESDRAVQDALTEMADRATGVIEDLETKKSQAEALVHVIGNTGMAGGYKKVADEERKAARFWQGVAAVSMAGIVVFAILAFVVTLEGDVDWPAFAGRAFVSVTFGILGAYAAQLAARHQESERRNRRMELELASIDPYLALLPDAERQDVKRKLAEKMFGQPDQPTLAREPLPTGSAIDLLRLTLENLSKR